MTAEAPATPLPRQQSNAIRCVLGMLGSDVHTKGIRTVASMLRSAGIDVVFAGEHLTIDQMVESVREAEPEFVGLSFSTAGYLVYMKLFTDAMKAAGLGHVSVMVGGLVHPDDEAALRGMGVSGLFGPGTTTQDIVSWLNRVSAEKTFQQ
ncbi:cobalamin B12-binding domain-containing protein [Novosphingobium resinovorum]|uniref:cobalamin B12-binding domain-containing protein n=1 Tax=Novosphingobium resinovorum TaxID=158500 RepID=UPI002ED10736|nr:cobalamin-dependent protein [Novosphingobium resinovorum]